MTAPHLRRKVLSSLRHALENDDLLGNALRGPTWARWRTLLIAANGEPLITDDERRLFTESTGRTTSPTCPVEEAAFVIGRRGGKDSAAAVLATYSAALCDHGEVLARGERGVVLCLGADQRQAKVQLDRIEGVFQGSPLLARMVMGRTQDSLTLANGIDIEVRAASFRRLRGVTALCVIASEVCFWQSDEFSANPDAEILNAVRPALATTGGPLILISSPYAKRGELYEIWKRHFGPDGDDQILVAQGASRAFNPTLAESVVARAMERDPQSAASEYGGLWRSDLESYIDRTVVESLITPGVFERPPIAGVEYFAYCDPSGGGGADSMTIAIGHRQQDGPDGLSIAVVDAIRECRPPFNPEDCVRSFCDLLQSYNHVRTVVGDKFGGNWPASRFLAAADITYVPAERATSDQYREFLPLMMGHRCDLVENPRMLAQLCSLERHVGRSGRDLITHPPNGHDDLACVIAGLCNLVIASKAAEIPDWGAGFATVSDELRRPSPSALDSWSPSHFEETEGVF